MRALEQGPSQKNRALQDVEIVLRLLVSASTQRSAMTFNRLGHVLLVTLNSNKKKIYNLSCALRNANFEYFTFSSKREAGLLALLAEANLLPTADTSVAALALEKEADILEAEKIAIRQYTSDEVDVVGVKTTIYEKWNALLRGNAMHYSALGADDVAIKKAFVNVLLVISGVNKNIAIRQEATLYRWLRELPSGMLVQLQCGNQVVRHASLGSFSEQDRPAITQPKTCIKIKNNSQGSIESISMQPSEREVLFSPLYFVTTACQLEEGRLSVDAQIVRGVCTEHRNQYVVESALSAAHEHLSKPYSEESEQQYDKIYRPNHALAHHVRVVSYADAVIAYFKQFSGDIEFQQFCCMLTKDEIDLIKVLLAFSKTGRESEASPFGATLETYQRYQQASADKMAQFMRDYLGLSEERINYYTSILCFMGDPDFNEKTTGTPEEIKTKGFINHIISLSHKLDLPRCYTDAEFQRSMSVYEKTQSEAQTFALNQLKLQARRTLIVTGDQIQFSWGGVDQASFDKNRFVKCNSDLFYCMDVCVAAQLGAAVESIDQLSERVAQCLDFNALLAFLSQLLFTTTFPQSPRFLAIASERIGVLTITCDALCCLVKLGVFHIENTTLIELFAVILRKPGVIQNVRDLSMLLNIDELGKNLRDLVITTLVDKIQAFIITANDLYCLLNCTNLNEAHREKILQIIGEKKLFELIDRATILCEFLAFQKLNDAQRARWIWKITQEKPLIDFVKTIADLRAICIHRGLCNGKREAFFKALLANPARLSGLFKHDINQLTIFLNAHAGFGDARNKQLIDAVNKQEEKDNIAAFFSSYHGNGVKNPKRLTQRL